MAAGAHEKFNLKAVLRLVVFCIVAYVSMLLARALFQAVVHAYYTITMWDASQANGAIVALNSNAWVQALGTLVQSVVLVLVALAYLRGSKEPVTLDRLGLKFSGDSLKLIIAAIGIDIVAFLSLNALVLLTGIATIHEYGFTKSGAVGVALSAVLALISTFSIVVGMEVLIHGYLQRTLTDRYGIGIALPIACVVYVLGDVPGYFINHHSPIMSIAWLIPFALTLGFMFYKTGSLWICIGFNFMHDFLVRVFISRTWSVSASPMFTLSGSSPVISSASWLGDWQDVFGFAVMLAVLLAFIAYYLKRSPTMPEIAIAGH